MPVAIAQDWREVLTLLRVRTGQDFSNYKPATIRRRVERRMGVRDVQTLADYAQLMRDNSEEAALLMRELLISVTNFFRDPEAFAALERDVIPPMFLRHSGGGQVRVWSAGCATGEEAYSIAITLVEYLQRDHADTRIQIFATDVSDNAIEYARAGVYSRSIESDVSADRLRRFFTKHDAGYRITTMIRDLCVFARQDLTRDPPFSRLDLIVCRNVLIYLGAPLQKRVMDKATGAPALASAANIAAFNLGNAAGAYLGGLTIEHGLGYTAPNWVGAALAVTGLLVALISGLLDRTRVSALTLEGSH